MKQATDTPKETTQEQEGDDMRENALVAGNSHVILTSLDGQPVLFKVSEIAKVHPGRIETSSVVAIIGSVTNPTAVQESTADVLAAIYGPSTAKVRAAGGETPKKADKT